MSYCKITERDIETLSKLAERYMSYALSDKNIENRKMWIALNKLNMQKPMITYCKNRTAKRYGIV